MAADLISEIGRLARAMERLADALGGAPRPTPARPFLVPKGAKVEWLMPDDGGNFGVPIGMDAIIPVVPGNYDGAIEWSAFGAGAVAPENADGSEARLTLQDGAAAGDELTVTATADTRHGPGRVVSTHEWTFEVLDRDAAPLEAAGGPRLVPAGAPADAGG